MRQPKIEKPVKSSWLSKIFSVISTSVDLNRKFKKGPKQGEISDVVFFSIFGNLPLDGEIKEFMIFHGSSIRQPSFGS